VHPAYRHNYSYVHPTCRHPRERGDPKTSEPCRDKALDSRIRGMTGKSAAGVLSLLQTPNPDP